MTWDSTASAQDGLDAAVASPEAMYQASLLRRFDLLEQLIRELPRRLAELVAGRAAEPPVRDYTVKEAAQELKKADWTVRNWLNHGQASGWKVPGRGHGEWRMSAAEVGRLKIEGPSHPGTFQNDREADLPGGLNVHCCRIIKLPAA